MASFLVLSDLVDNPNAPSGADATEAVSAVQTSTTFRTTSVGGWWLLSVGAVGSTLSFLKAAVDLGASRHRVDSEQWRGRLRDASGEP